MSQLKMVWEYTSNMLMKEIVLPSGFTYRSFVNCEEDIDVWLNLMQYGLTEKKEKKEYFEKCMLSHKNLEFDKIYFIENKGVPCASITVICDYDMKEGYIHMVVCDPVCRGKGIGTQLNTIAVNTLISSGMKTAYLTTDDFRIPAIKSYLRAGFVPDLSTDDFKVRWLNIYDKINGA